MSILEPSRKREISAIRETFVQLTPLALSVLTDVMVSPTASQSLKAKVATTVLEFGWGKPTNSNVYEKTSEFKIILDDSMRRKLEDALERAKILMNQYQPSPETQTVLESVSVPTTLLKP